VVTTKQATKLTNKKRKRASQTEKNSEDKIKNVKKIKVAVDKSDKFAEETFTVTVDKKQSNKLKKNLTNEMKTGAIAEVTTTATGTYVKSVKSKKKEKRKLKNKPRDEISDSRLEAFGINPKKYRNQLKYSGGMNEGHKSMAKTRAVTTISNKILKKKKNIQKNK